MRGARPVLPDAALAQRVGLHDRGTVRAGIVHLGVGGFHRSHQAMYLDRLMEQGQALDWGICGVGVLPGDRRMAEVMAAQDCLYTLMVSHPDGFLGARVVGSMVEYLLAPDDPEAVVERMADPAIRIVSLTVTEGGYNVDAVTGAFDATDSAVLADVAPGAVPRTSFGLVIAALVRRRERGIAPFTVMSCDNIPGNGDVARRSFAAFAALRDPALGEWDDREVSFPHSMVDRITPATTDVHRTELSRRFDVEDRWPARLCAESSDRIPKFLLPVLRANLASGGEIRCAVAVLAGWARYAEGVGEDGRSLEVVDPLRGRLMAAARRQAYDPLAFVSDRELFGDLVDDARFAETYRATLELVRSRGARAALEEVLRTC